MRNNFFSIIITTFNSALYINKTINGIIKQNFSNYEIILVDDCSTDNTLNLINKNFGKKIQIFSTDKNFGGPSKSRNIGIEKSSGEWISFLDGDDFWFQNRLHYFYQFIKKYPEKDIFCSNEMMLNIETGKKNKILHGPYTENFFSNLLINGNKLSPSATIIRADFIKKKKIFFDEKPELIGVEDYDFWLNLAKNNANFYFINKTLNVYKIHKKNISNDSKKHMENTINVINKNFRFLETNNRDKKYSYRIYIIRFSFLINQIKKKKNVLTNLIKAVFSGIINPIFTIRFVMKKII